MKKQKIIKAWAAMKKDFLLNWIVDTRFTGAYALFENRSQANAAIKYNDKLMKIQKMKRENYKAVPCEIKILKK